MLIKIRGPRANFHFTTDTSACIGRNGPAELAVPAHLQHGAEPAARAGHQPAVHAREVLLPVPELLLASGALSE